MSWMVGLGFYVLDGRAGFYVLDGRAGFYVLDGRAGFYVLDGRAGFYVNEGRDEFSQCTGESHVLTQFQISKKSILKFLKI